MHKTLSDYQREIGQWSFKNFGEPKIQFLIGSRAMSVGTLLGVMEEIGEVCHGVLKMSQGIRGTEGKHMEEIRDGIGDALIYLLDFCAQNGLSAQVILEETWEKVRQRDWRKNAHDGTVDEHKDQA